MGTEPQKPSLRRKLLLGFKIGLGVLVFDFFVVFGFPPLREAIRGTFSRLMEPVFLVAPLTFAVTCLLLYWILPDQRLED